MPSDNLITRVHGGERVISADGICVGTVSQVHFRDAEAFIEVRLHTFWNALLEGLALRPMQPASGHLFLPAQAITQVAGKRVHLRLNATTARECVSRPPWIEHQEKGLHFHGMD